MTQLFRNRIAYEDVHRTSLKQIQIQPANYSLNSAYSFENRLQKSSNTGVDSELSHFQQLVPSFCLTIEPDFSRVI